MEAPASLGGWKGRAILIAQNPETNKWQVLLGHTRSVGKLWGVFTAPANPGEKGTAKAASRALKAQTNGAYAIDIDTVKNYHVENGDADWYFVRVGKNGVADFISAEQLHARAQNQIMDDFVWVNVDDLMQKKVIKCGDCGKVPAQEEIVIFQRTKNFLQKKLKDAIAAIADHQAGLRGGRIR